MQTCRVLYVGHTLPEGKISRGTLTHEELRNRNSLRKAEQSWRSFFLNRIIMTSYWDEIQWQILFSLNLLDDPLLLHANGDFPDLQYSFLSHNNNNSYRAQAPIQLTFSSFSAASLSAI